MNDETTHGIPMTDAGDAHSLALPHRPGKIIAIHLSYSSRADQRGHRPAAPSYFFKPSSSVAASGGTIERPAGAELLAFEGEIALVIGAKTRRVALEDAWSHVAAVTAANDFGLYDLRANDKGSNVRSKGGDGFTPIGPALIDARAFDAVGEGEVIVIEARGETGCGTLGDVLALRARAKGAAGIVTDGGIRDYDAVADIGLPIYSGGAHPAVLGRKHVPWDHDVTIGCGGTTLQPGDVIVGDGDGDGVIVIPPALVEEVVDAALAQEDEDAWVAEQVAAGHRIDGLFPVNATWRATYDAHTLGQEPAEDGR